MLVLSYKVVLFFTDEEGYEDYAPNSRAMRLADPELLYASSIWSGLCSNEEGEVGGCTSEMYLYKSGRLMEETGWEGLEGEKETNRLPARLLDQAIVDQVIEKISGFGIMTMDCPNREIMDAGWSYQLTFDGVTKTFDNPPEECEEIFDEIDLLIDFQE